MQTLIELLADGKIVGVVLTYMFVTMLNKRCNDAKDMGVLLSPDETVRNMMARPVANFTVLIMSGWMFFIFPWYVVICAFVAYIVFGLFGQEVLSRCNFLMKYSWLLAEGTALFTWVHFIWY